MCGITPSPEMTDLIKEGVGPAVSVLLGMMFLRRNTKNEEIEKLKAGKFMELAEELLDEGKMSYQEFYRCTNFLKVARLADEHLRGSGGRAVHSNREESSDFDIDWFVRFYDAVGTVSNSDMQRLWARVLAGKTSGRGKYSLRAIEMLHDMSPREAAVFHTVASMVVSDGSLRPGILCTTQDIPDVNAYYGLDADAIEAITDCGILMGTRSEVALFDDINDSHIFDNGAIALVLDPTNEDAALMSLFLYPLSAAAVELLDALDVASNNNYILDLGKAMSEVYGDSLNISAMPVYSSKGTIIELENKNLLLDYEYAAGGLGREVALVIGGKYGRNTSVHHKMSGDSM